MPTPRKIIIWALVRSQFEEARSLIRKRVESYPLVVNASLDQFRLDPFSFDAADAVYVMRGHESSEACANLYREKGAVVEMFGDDVIVGEVVLAQPELLMPEPEPKPKKTRN